MKQGELRRRDALCAVCLAVYGYVATTVVLSLWTDLPSWVGLLHLAVVLIAIGLVYATLRDIATRSDWTHAQRVSWRNWMRGFSLLAAAAYYWLHMRSR
jgi:hypothetical protein